MPSKDAHISAARRNEDTLRHLLSGGDEHLGWVATVAFYKALHIVEAVFHEDPNLPLKHTDDHKLRNKTLKNTARYQHIWKMYRELWQASLVARYLREDETSAAHPVFEVFMPRDKVESLLLGHYLAQVEKSAAKFLGADFLK